MLPRMTRFSKGSGGLIEIYSLNHLEHMIVLFGHALVAEISIFHFDTNWLLTSFSVRVERV